MHKPTHFTNDGPGHECKCKVSSAFVGHNQMSIRQEKVLTGETQLVFNPRKHNWKSSVQEYVLI